MMSYKCYIHSTYTKNFAKFEWIPCCLACIGKNKHDSIYMYKRVKNVFIYAKRESLHCWYEKSHKNKQSHSAQVAWQTKKGNHEKGLDTTYENRILMSKVASNEHFAYIHRDSVDFSDVVRAMTSWPHCFYWAIKVEILLRRDSENVHRMCSKKMDNPCII